MPRRTKEKESHTGLADGKEQPEPIEVVRLEFGPFAEVSRLNPRFVPQRERLKLTLDVHPAGQGPGASPASLLEPLSTLLPGLRRHRCGDNSRITETTLRRSRKGDPSGESGADVAHMLEHIIIDFQHEIAAMSICSGVTCGYESPRNRYDVFIESPGRRVSRLCITLACELMNGLLRGQQPDPLYVRIVGLARRIYRNGTVPLAVSDAGAASDGDTQLAAALRVLSELQFVREMDTSFNFSRVPLYSLLDDEAHLKS